jgi:actin
VGKGVQDLIANYEVLQQQQQKNRSFSSAARKASEEKSGNLEELARKSSKDLRKVSNSFETKLQEQRKNSIAEENSVYLGRKGSSSSSGNREIDDSLEKSGNFQGSKKVFEKIEEKPILERVKKLEQRISQEKEFSSKSQSGEHRLERKPSADTKNLKFEDKLKSYQETQVQKEADVKKIKEQNLIAEKKRLEELKALEEAKRIQEAKEKEEKLALQKAKLLEQQRKLLEKKVTPTAAKLPEDPKSDIRKDAHKGDLHQPEKLDIQKPDVYAKKENVVSKENLEKKVETKENDDSQCQTCKNKHAELFCQNCLISLCESCDRKSHNFKSTHLRTPIIRLENNLRRQSQESKPRKNTDESTKASSQSSKKYWNKNSPIVIDLGSTNIKTGLINGSYTDPILTPAVIGCKKYRNAIIDEMDDQKGQLFIGEEAISKKGILGLRYPMQNGSAVNWDDMEKLLDYVVLKKLKIRNSEEHALLVSESYFTPRVRKERIARILFDSFEAPAVCFSMQEVLSLYATGNLTGTVLQSGEDFSSIVSVYEGYPLFNGHAQVDLAGNSISLQLLKCLNDRGYSFTSAGDMDSINKLKTELCYVAKNYEEECRKDSSEIEKQYELPDGRILKLQNELFQAPEVLFNPSLASKPTPGIHKSIIECIQKCDNEIQPNLLKNIVISGSSTLYSGFAERITKEITSISPLGMKASVKTDFDRENSSFIGGSIFSSIESFRSQCILKEEYHEYGISIVHRKCF